jgi:hypothetical protein
VVGGNAETCVRACVLQDVEERRESRRLQTELLAVWRRTLGNEDYCTLTAMGNLSQAHEAEGVRALCLPQLSYWHAAAV